MLTIKNIPFLAFFRALPQDKKSAQQTPTLKAQFHKNTVGRLNSDPIGKKLIDESRAVQIRKLSDTADCHRTPN
jgi:hypothetical protein